MCLVCLFVATYGGAFLRLEQIGHGRSVPKWPHSSQSTDSAAGMAVAKCNADFDILKGKNLIHEKTRFICAGGRGAVRRSHTRFAIWLRQRAQQARQQLLAPS